MTSGTSIFNFKHVLHFILPLKFEQIIAGWAWETAASDNEFVSNIMSYGLGKFVGLCVFVFIHPTQGCERINFHNKSNPGLKHHIGKEKCSARDIKMKSNAV